MALINSEQGLNLPVLKHDLRIRVREALAAEWKRPDHSVHCDSLQARISSFLSRRPGVWLAYSGRLESKEVVLAPPATIEFCYPRIEEQNLVYYRPQRGVASTWQSGPFGIKEPTADRTWRRIHLEQDPEIVGVIVPGLAFDRRLMRLGKGGGYFDRFLNQQEVKQAKILKIAVAYSCQIVTEVPVEDHDVGLDAVITEADSVWDFRGYRKDLAS